MHAVAGACDCEMHAVAEACVVGKSGRGQTNGKVQRLPAEPTAGLVKCAKSPHFRQIDFKYVHPLRWRYWVDNIYQKCYCITRLCLL